jgi:hypothetical protein
MATEAGLPGLHIVGMSADRAWRPADHGFDAKVALPLVQGRQWVSRRRPIAWLRDAYGRRRGLPTIHDYQALMARQVAPGDLPATDYPCLVHAWDNTPRSGARGVVFAGTSGEAFRPFLRDALAAVQDRAPDHRIVVLKSWNEWAEGNHLEPDLRDGRSYLDVIRGEVDRLAEG